MPVPLTLLYCEGCSAIGFDSESPVAHMMDGPLCVRCRVPMSQYAIVPARPSLVRPAPGESNKRSILRVVARSRLRAQ